uniref:Uncharacterized protein n=1 Tax=Spongospora subterranea TaxID=70186 RepID=A0A0H5QKE7_9EUKA|eukprot:CRZ02097.1 hypothetical protein [Spongospora subterranea]
MRSLDVPSAWSQPFLIADPLLPRRYYRQPYTVVLRYLMQCNAIKFHFSCLISYFHIKRSYIDCPIEIVSPLLLHRDNIEGVNEVVIIGANHHVVRSCNGIGYGVICIRKTGFMPDLQCTHILDNQFAMKSALIVMFELTST